MPDVSDIPDIPEVSTEAQRQALDAMSEELVQKLNRMIEEQDARVREFAVQNPSLSSLPATPDPIVLPQRELPQVPQKPVVAKPAALPAEPVPVERPIPNPPVPAPSRPKPKRQRQVAPNQEEKSSNIGSWVFFIVVVLIILRACTE